MQDITNPFHKLRLLLQKPRDNTYLFILSPPFSGSTMLYQILSTSPYVTKFSSEGQFIGPIKSIMRERPWDENKKMPWEKIKKAWHKKWDLRKPFLAEKSPPNLLRAKVIEEQFQPSYFIILMRNPYAFCEGFTRRKGESYEEAAKFWIKCALFQKKNINELSSHLFISYEELVEYPNDVKQNILAYLPGLYDISVDQPFKAKTIEGTISTNIKNYNEKKIRKLPKNAIQTINQTLLSYKDLVNDFNYNLIQ